MYEVNTGNFKGPNKTYKIFTNQHLFYLLWLQERWPAYEMLVFSELNKCTWLSEYLYHDQCIAAKYCLLDDKTPFFAPTESIVYSFKCFHWKKKCSERVGLFVLSVTLCQSVTVLSKLVYQLFVGIFCARHRLWMRNVYIGEYLFEKKVGIFRRLFAGYTWQVLLLTAKHMCLDKSVLS